MSYELNIDLDRGLDFRPRCVFANANDYFMQFVYLARPKLQKRIFLELPAGIYLVTDGGGLRLEIAPKNERADQWKSIPPIYRQKGCAIYRNKAHYEATLEALRAVMDENTRKLIVPYDPFDL